VIQVQPDGPDTVIVGDAVGVGDLAVNMTQAICPDGDVSMAPAAVLAARAAVVVLGCAEGRAFRPDEPGIQLVVTFARAAVPASERVAAEDDAPQVGGCLITALGTALEAGIKLW